MSQANPVPGRDDCSESLSCLIDGELDEGECRHLLARLAGDAAARGAWVRLNVACDAMRSSETAAMHSTSFIARVSAALDGEPVILAPGATRRRYMLLRRVGLPVAAVAAAAVLLTVVAVPQLRGDGAKVELAKDGAPALSVVQPVSVERSVALEDYLRAHRENAAGVVSSRAADFGVIPATMQSSVESR
jgi:negative regulator of sigma E activity